MASIIQPAASAGGFPSMSPMPTPPSKTRSSVERDPESVMDTSVTQKMLSATVGSVLTAFIVTPLDVVRVRQQAQTSPSYTISQPISSTSFSRLPPNLGISACCRNVFFLPNTTSVCIASPGSAALAECAAEESERRSFKSTFDGIRKIARNEGPATLWRGLSPTLAMGIPANIIYFAGYDWMRTHPTSIIKTRFSDTYAPLVAGSVARIFAAAAVGPIEMLRTRMQASQSTQTGQIMKDTIQGIQRMVANNGYTSLWRGLNLTLWRDVPFSAFYWWGYEKGREVIQQLRHPDLSLHVGQGESAQLRRRTLDTQSHHQTVFLDSFAAGATSGAIAAFFTTPFDVGKTRQQTARYNNSSTSTLVKTLRPEQQTMPRFLWHIFETEGVRGLFKGWAARCMKVAPACAIMISTYEVGKKLAGSP